MRLLIYVHGLFCSGIFMGYTTPLWDIPFLTIQKNQAYLNKLGFFRYLTGFHIKPFGPNGIGSGFVKSNTIPFFLYDIF